MFKTLSVSLNQPKVDDCEDCVNLALVPNSLSNETSWALENHQYKAYKANVEYRKDSQKKESSSVRYFSMDLH